MVDLPALPTTILRVVRAIEDGAASSAQIEQIIINDAAVTAKVLKTVNSPYFGMARQVTSVNHAIQVLGLTQLRNVTLSIGVLNALSTTSPRIQQFQKTCWERSFVSAAVAHKIASEKGLPKDALDAVLIGALLHDIGELFLLTLFNVPYTEVKTRSIKLGQAMSKVERQILGTSHADLGASLAEKWSLPGELVDMIRYHEMETEFPEVPPLLACVHLADRIVNRLEAEGDIEARYPFVQSALDWAGFTEESLAKYQAFAAEQLEKARAEPDAA